MDLININKETKSFHFRIMHATLFFRKKDTQITKQLMIFKNTNSTVQLTDQTNQNNVKYYTHIQEKKKKKKRSLPLNTFGELSRMD